MENVIDLKQRTVHSSVKMYLAKMCNVRASKFDLRNTSDIITSVLNVFSSGRSTSRFHIFHSANTFVSGRLSIRNGNLLREFATFRAVVGTVFVSINSKHSASVHCTDGKSQARIRGGQLVANVLDFPQNRGARINASVYPPGIDPAFCLN